MRQQRPANPLTTRNLNHRQPSTIRKNTHLGRQAYVNLVRGREDREDIGLPFVAGITQGLRSGRQSVGKGECGGFNPVACVCLVVDVRDMTLDGPTA